MSNSTAENSRKGVIPYHQSPLFYVGIGLLVLGLRMGLALFHFMGLGLAIIAIDFALRNFILRRPMLYLSQSMVMLSLIAMWYFQELPGTMRLFIVLPENFSGKVGVVFGVENAPIVENGDTIRKLPSNNVLVTSTQISSQTNVDILLLVQGQPRNGALIGSNTNACKNISYQLYEVPNERDQKVRYPSNPNGIQDRFIDSIVSRCNQAPL